VSDQLASHIAELLDRQAIADLISKYCDALDFRRWELLDDVFVPNLISHWPHGDAEGREVTVGYIKKAFTWLGATHHQAGNVAISFDADGGADVSTRMRCHHRGGDDRAHLFEESLAAFGFKAVKTSDGWRFGEITEQILVMLGDEDVFAGPAGSPTPLGQFDQGR